MRILNLTHSVFWFPEHFKRLLAEAGHTGETLYRSEGSMSAEKANQLWHEYKDYFDSFDAVMVSHVASWSRVFLQNGWKKPLYVWFFFRFDHDVPDLPEFYQLLMSARLQSNVKFFAATDYDLAYAKSRLPDFDAPVIRPFMHIENAGKKPVNCQNRFYLVGKHNESLFSDRLTEMQIPFYQQTWETGVPDLRGVKAVLHFPYVYATRSLIENLALENVYFLPSQQFLRDLDSTTPNYFWDGGLPDEARGDYSRSEWYLDKHRDLMIYFNSWEDLENLSRNAYLPEIIADKKAKIREFNARQYPIILKQWKSLLDGV